MITDTRISTPTICATKPDEKFVINWGDGRDRDVKPSKDILTSLSFFEAMELGLAKARELRQLMGTCIDQWVKKYHHEIQRCWISERDGSNLLIVISKSSDYNEELHDSLIDLGAEINVVMGDHPIRVRTLMLPGIGEHPERAFLSPRMKHLLYPPAAEAG